MSRNPYRYEVDPYRVSPLDQGPMRDARVARADNYIAMASAMLARELESGPRTRDQFNPGRHTTAEIDDALAIMTSLGIVTAAGGTYTLADGHDVRARVRDALRQTR